MTDFVQALKNLSTADLSDAMDRLGIVCQCFGIMPLHRSFHLVGQAWTLRYGPIGAGGGSIGDYIDDVGPGQVVTLDNSGRLDATVWGDLLTSTAALRRVAGTVVDGVCRDIDRALELEYPIFARGNWMRTGKDRVRVEAIGVPVSIGGIRVEAGDWLRGDGDGLVVIPHSRTDEVILIAQEVHEAEEHIRSAIMQGSDLRKARADYGYHSLQTRR